MAHVPTTHCGGGGGAPITSATNACCCAVTADVSALPPGGVHAARGFALMGPSGIIGGMPSGRNNGTVLATFVWRFLLADIIQSFRHELPPLLSAKRCWSEEQRQSL